MQSMYLQRIMKKNAAKGYEKTKPKQTQLPKVPKRTQISLSQRIMKMNHLKAPKKQTQTNPVLSAACPEHGRMGRMGQFSPQF